MMSRPGWRVSTPAELRCRRCGRTQPPLPQGVGTCVYCGYPLPVQRWVAHPPAGVPRPPAPTRPRPYRGPPSYGPTHPSWGFPPIVWRRATAMATATNPGVMVPRRGLQVLTGSALLAAVLCVVAAGGELWRWVLMLRGRTEVLSAGAVRASDVLVATAGVAAAVAGAVTLLVALPVVVRTHAAADARAGLAPSRSPADVLTRLVVPVWNLYGAGQVFVEIDSRLRARAGAPVDVAADAPLGAAGDGAVDVADVAARPRASRSVLGWWTAWIANGVLVLIALGRAFGGSLQALADTVELHLMVDLVAAVVAGLSVVLFRRWVRALTPENDPYRGWVVAPPAPTRHGLGSAADRTDESAALSSRS